MFEIFLKGGPIMWPLLLTSLVALTVVIERLIFTVRETRKRDPVLVEQMLSAAENGDFISAVRVGEASRDVVALTLVYALRHNKQAFSNALLRAASRELKRFNRGLPILDTIITLAPLLGLLGTVIGMIRAFGLIGGELDAPTAITGGVAEALIATAFGLAIAITALIPFNYLNARLEEARHEIQDAATHLELLVGRSESAEFKAKPESE